jgi:hypothetical protein
MLSGGEAPRVELDELLDKTTVQGLSVSWGLSAVLHWYRSICGIRSTGLSPFSRKLYRTYNEYFYFYFIPMKSHLDDRIWIPIYKTIPAMQYSASNPVCMESYFFTLRHGECMCCGPSCGLWLCVGALKA